MSGIGRYARSSRFLRVLGLGAACLALGNCASGDMSSRVNHNASVIAATADVSQERHRTVHRATVIGGRPAGCPQSFCGCEASRYLFGQVRRDLNLASNWKRKFPKASPAPGMAAVRNHHVFVLMRHVEGSNWLVHDGNSGRGLTREHVRSIKGYTVVDPQSTRISKSVLAQTD
jgi:hypothetical protein